MIPFALQHAGLGMIGSRYVLDPAYTWASEYTGNTYTLSDSNALMTWTAGIASSEVFHIRTDTALSGKVYCEFEVVSEVGSTNYHAFGIATAANTGFLNSGAWVMYSRSPAGSAGCGLGLSGLRADGSNTTDAAYSFEPGDRIGIAFDASTGELWYRKNGTWIAGDPAAGTGETHTASAGTYYFVQANYSCGAANVNPVVRIYPSAASQLSAAPSGFSPYQP